MTPSKLGRVVTIGIAVSDAVKYTQTIADGDKGITPAAGWNLMELTLVTELSEGVLEAETLLRELTAELAGQGDEPDETVYCFVVKSGDYDGGRYKTQLRRVIARMLHTHQGAKLFTTDQRLRLRPRQIKATPTASA